MVDARAVVTGFVLLAMTGSAQAAGDTDRGRGLAEQWCAECHLVSPEQASATEGAPPFAEIGAKRSEEEIRGFLFDPHPPMGPLRLSRQDTADLIAYIAAQAPNP